jgi:hypothetical protein
MNTNPKILSFQKAQRVVKKARLGLCGVSHYSCVLAALPLVLILCLA